MKIAKKLLLGLGTFSATIAPIAIVISCGSGSNKLTKNISQTDSSLTKQILKSKHEVISYLSKPENDTKDVIISLPKGTKIDFSSTGPDFDHDINLMWVTFDSMDMAGVTIPRNVDVLKNTTFKNVDNLQSVIKQTIFQNDLIHNEGMINAKFIDINGALDFSKVNVEFATFQDMDMSKVKTMDGKHSFTSSTFNHVINLDLSKKEFEYAVFKDVNNGIGDDCSKIPGHPSFLAISAEFKQILLSFNGYNGRGKVKLFQPIPDGEKWEYNIYLADGSDPITWKWDTELPENLKNYDFFQIRSVSDSGDILFSTDKLLVSNLKEEIKYNSITLKPNNFKVQGNIGTAKLVKNNFPVLSSNTELIYQVFKKGRNGFYSLIVKAQKELPSNLDNGEIIRASLISTDDKSLDLFNSSSVDIYVEGLLKYHKSKLSKKLLLIIGIPIFVVVFALLVFFKKLITRNSKYKPKREEYKL